MDGLGVRKPDLLDVAVVKVQRDAPAAFIALRMSGVAVFLPPELLGADFILPR